jgi:hypothetical protein
MKNPIIVCILGENGRNIRINLENHYGGTNFFFTEETKNNLKFVKLFG